MSPEQFIYWLNGFMEIADQKTIDENQVQIIKDHIALVLKKETPDRKLEISSPLLQPGNIRPRSCPTGGTLNPCRRSDCLYCSSLVGSLRTPAITC